MAKSKNKRKNRGKSQQRVKISPKAYVKKVARKLPVECKITSGWQERGNAQVMVIRKRTNGQYIVGFYMVDIWCLGLKDTFYRSDLDAYEFEEMIEKFEAQSSMSGEHIVDCDPQLAYNIIYGCIEYAEDLGFSPPKEFAITEYILDDVDEIDYMDIEFGRDGEPSYFSGPYDNVQKNLSILNKNVGEGNYEFVTHLDDDGGMWNTNAPTEADIKDHPYSTRPEIAKVLSGLSEEEALAYFLQLQIADKVHLMFGGDLESIEENYSEELVDDIVEEMKEALNPDIEGEEAEEFQVMLFEIINSTLAQIMNAGDAEFFFEEGYKPIIEPPDFEELQKMSPEEAAQRLADYSNRMPPAQMDEMMIPAVTLRAVNELLGDEDRPLTIEEKEQLKIDILKTIEEKDLIQMMDTATVEARVKAAIKELDIIK